MANECLVTKLKGVVNNDNLPKYGVFSFNFSREFALSEATLISFQIGAKVGGNPVHVTTKVPFTPYGSQTKVSTFTIAPGANVYGSIYFADSEMLSGKVDELIQADNMYDISFAYMVSCQDTAMQKNNIVSLNKYVPLEITSVNKDDNFDIADSAYYLQISTCPGFTAGMVNADKYLEYDNLEAINVSTFGSGVELTKNFNSNTTFKYLFAGYKGSILNLPLNIEYFMSTGASGEITEWVAQMRAQGRTTGRVCLNNVNYGYTTYNGTSLKTLVDNNTIPVVNGQPYKLLLTWDASNIIWADIAPEDAVITTISASIYYAKKHS